MIHFNLKDRRHHMKNRISKLVKLSMVYVLMIFMLGSCTKDAQKSKQKPEGLFPVIVSGKIGYIDKQGKIVINPQFDDAWHFSEGLAGVKIGGKWGYIDKQGKIIINPLLSKII